MTSNPAWECRYRVRWRDVDAAGHLSNSGYLDLCSDARFVFLSENGFGASQFARHGIRPVAFSDHITYKRELRLLDEARVTLELTGAAPDGSAWRLRQQILRMDGSIAASLSSEGAWLDVSTRTLAHPPEDLARALLKVPLSHEFEELERVRESGTIPPE